MSFGVISFTRKRWMGNVPSAEQPKDSRPCTFSPKGDTLTLDSTSITERLVAPAVIDASQMTMKLIVTSVGDGWVTVATKSYV